MLSYLAKKLFGTANDRVIKSFQKIVNLVNEFEPMLQMLTNEQLQAKTIYFREQLAQGSTLDDIMPEAFAVVREASKRVLNMRHFDVQILGGIVLHKGMIAEMKTGEGKTLVATLAVYLNALTAKGVHVVTVNDYLVKRDSEWMGQLYKFLGLEVGYIKQGLTDDDRRAAYHADITYGTNNEFGFDYLRDNLKYSEQQMVQRPANFALIDEVDSILIDEARTPLIISGPTEDNSELYYKVDKLIEFLDKADFEIDEKNKSSVLTDKGNLAIEQLLKDKAIIGSGSSLYELENMSVVHHVNQALKAHTLFRKDVDYIVKDGKLLIIDEFTGRIMDGRRYSEGLHQALEAKEGLQIQNENQTIASVTFQNYFRMYPKLAGMTGTAMTEAQEFEDIYKLRVVSIPTNVAVQRKDQDDQVYLTMDEKDKAIIREIEQAYAKDQPVLVGTVSIERSEHLSSLLIKKGIKHNVLNARFHEQEAEIIAQAGKLKAVTIATNMAGRGTDIKLGGNLEMLLREELKKKPEASAAEIAKIESKIANNIEEDKQKIFLAGGLLVIGTERHESRRIDNQLRGRSGRQGDPGRTVFYLSLEDDLMRIFGTDKLKGLFSKMGLKADEAVHAPMLTRALEKAQLKIEARNYDIRKNLLKFDDVMNDQRRVIYDQRKFIMSDEDIPYTISATAIAVFEDLHKFSIPKDTLPENWNLEWYHQEMLRIFGLNIPFRELAAKEGVDDEYIFDFAKKAIEEHFAKKNERYKSLDLASAYRHIMLITLDYLWKDHLHKLDHLRTGIGLRAYAQKDPLNEYKIETFKLFSQLLDEIAIVTVMRASHLEIAHEVENFQERLSKIKVFEVEGNNVATGDGNSSDNIVQLKKKPYMTESVTDSSNPQSWGKVARNEICPCGSGKKFKHCHGVAA